MSSSAIETCALACGVRTTKDLLVVTLDDGRSISVPLPWFPRLAHGTAQERREWRLIGGGRGIHWPALDEDISVEHLLAGFASRESKASLKRWLDSRKRPKPKLTRRKASPRSE
jgi:hypothetical protein